MFQQASYHRNDPNFDKIFLPVARQTIASDNISRIRRMQEHSTVSRHAKRLRVLRPFRTLSSIRHAAIDCSRLIRRLAAR